MTTLQEALERHRRSADDKPRPIPAPRTYELPLSAFSADWGGRPNGPLVIGLRIPAEQDVQIISQEAARLAMEAYPGDPEKQNEAWKTGMIRMLVCRAVCDPNDAAAAHPSFRLADDMVPRALTGDAIKRIFDEVEKLTVETSPGFAEATDEMAFQLGALLVKQEAFEALQAASPVRAARVRRFVRFILDELDPVED